MTGLIEQMKLARKHAGYVKMFKPWQKKTGLEEHDKECEGCS